MRHWPTFAAAGLLALAVASPAGAVTHHDVRALDDLYKRALDLSQSLTTAETGGVSQLNASGDPQVLDCLETLREASGEVADQLMDVKDVAGLAAGLHGARDRRHGDAATRAAAARALDVLPVEQKQITQTAGLCLSQTTVQQQARDASQLVTDATTALQAVR